MYKKSIIKLFLLILILFKISNLYGQGEWRCGQYVTRQVANTAPATGFRTEVVQFSTNLGGTTLISEVKATINNELINSTVFYGGFIWGWQQYPNNTAQTGNGTKLFKIGNDGSIVSTFDPSNPDLSGEFNSAFVDENGIYHIGTSSTQNSVTLSRIDLKTNPPTQLSDVVVTLPAGFNTNPDGTATTTVNMGDYVVSNGEVYFWLNGRGLAKFPLPSAAQTTATATVISPQTGTGSADRVRGMGSLFVNSGDPNFIFAYGSDAFTGTNTYPAQNKLMKISKATGAITVIDSGTPVAQSDGCGCPFETFVVLPEIIDTDQDEVLDAGDYDADNDGVPDDFECPIFETNADNMTVLKGTASDLQLNDALLKTNAITYLGVQYDAIIKIASKNGTVSNTPAGLVLTGAPNINPFVTATVTFVKKGSSSSTNIDGIPATIRNGLLTFYDIDGSNPTGTKEIYGYLSSVTEALADPGTDVDLITNTTTKQGFIVANSGTPPPGFKTFAQVTTPLTNVLPDNNVGEPNSFIVSYDALTSTQFLFGYTGTSTVATTSRTLSMYFSSYWRCDSDGDGIPNILDYDSDNDGCNDSREGGSTPLTNLPKITSDPTQVNSIGIPLQVLADKSEPAPDPPVLTYTPTFEGRADDPNVNGCVVKLEGNLFYDINGNKNNNVDGTAFTAGTVKANLIGTDGKVVATTTIGTDGKYAFINITPGTYTVQISTVAGTTGQAAPTQTLPNGYVNTGDEFGTTQGTTENGISESISAIYDVAEVNFGIQEPPAAGTATQTTTVNPGGTTQAAVTSSLFGGSGTTTTTDKSSGTVEKIRITSFPTNATSIVINGTTYTSSTFPTSGVIITATNGVPAAGAISVDPVDGATNVVIPYKAIDNAGAESTNTGSVTVPFNTLAINGNVFNDNNGGTNANVDGAVYAAGDVKANLIGSDGKVIATTTVGPDGKYAFTNLTPGTYTVQISTLAGTTGQAAPTQTSPAGFVNTGDEIGTTQGTTANGVSENVVLTTANVAEVNFGIQEPPAAGTATQTTTVNPGGTTQAAVTSSLFGGSGTTTTTDKSSGTVEKIRITSFPTNATSIVINGTTYTSSTFPTSGVTITATNGVPAAGAITVDPVDGATSVVIPFKAIDNAGAESTNTGSVTVPFSAPIAGPLSVNLISFSGSQSSNIVALKWKTNNEKDFSHFELERRNSKNNEFVILQKFISSNDGFYNANDNSPFTGNNYYRLKMVDKDGTFTHSKTISVNFENENNDVEILGNPITNNKILVKTSSINPNFNVYSSTGMKIQTIVKSLGHNIFEIEIKNNLSPQIVNLIVQQNLHVKNIKVLIK